MCERYSNIEVNSNSKTLYLLHFLAVKLETILTQFWAIKVYILSKQTIFEKTQRLYIAHAFSSRMEHLNPKVNTE